MLIVGLSLLCFQASCRLNWLPTAEQPPGILVHGGFCATKFSWQ